MAGCDIFSHDWPCDRADENCTGESCCSDTTVDNAPEVDVCTSYNGDGCCGDQELALLIICTSMFTVGEPATRRRRLTSTKAATKETRKHYRFHILRNGKWDLEDGK
jgi:hypothetical protein